MKTRSELLGRAKSYLKPSKKFLGRVVFTQKPVKGSWGGSNQFVKQMEKVLEERGIDVAYALEGNIDVIVIVDPRKSGNKPIGCEDVEEYRAHNPHVRVLHRINECDRRKDTDFMDALLERANHSADYTVFISEWLRDYHAASWFDASKPHSVIYNGADPKFFYPSRERRDVNGTLRLVTHHWADNHRKGFDVYDRLDKLIARGELKNVDFTVIGRWPSDIDWQATTLVPPMQGGSLGDRLRECDAYITASRWEPCGMHQVEGIQCGLPLIYHSDGGGIVEVGRKCGVDLDESLVEAVESIRSNYQDFRSKAVELDLSGDKMCTKFASIVRRLMYLRRDSVA